MADERKMIDLDPKDFRLTDYDNVRITMPARPYMSEEDVEAQLFGYVLSGGRKIASISDLDDAWVKENFEGLDTIEDVKQAIRDQFDREMDYDMQDLKYHACCEALMARLEGDVPEDVLAHNIDAVRQANLERLAEMRLSFEQYLKEEGLSAEQYEERLREDVLHQMRMNVALDIQADVLGAQVGNHELTQYLSAPNPEAFLAEIREKGVVEEARRAAVRIKVMRRIMDTAIVEEEGAAEDSPASAASPAKGRIEDCAEEDDVVMPDLDHLPIPRIRDDKGDALSWEFAD